jgi:chemotaxis protein methyltransferase CheR
VRAAVTFEAANLASDDPQLWQPASYDVIFCRNVLMYFAPEKMRAVIARIARSLVPGGFLFLGHVETLRGVSDEFHLRHTHGTFYYERKEHIGRPFPQPLPPMPQAINADGPAYAASDAWFRTISESTERIAALVPTPARAGLAAGPPARTWDLAPAFELLRKERFAEALDYIRAGPPAGRDPDMLLLEAALLVHGQKVEAAEETCSRLLCIDELNAGAHYVLGLCREQLRDVDGAIEHYRVAAYLDPEFAMPRLHLGLLARRAGERGGFNREALMALCGSALADNGVRA